MKCGLIWARSARTSASIARVRGRPSSASSSWLETQRATSSVARTRPAAAAGRRRRGCRRRARRRRAGPRTRGADRAVRVVAGHLGGVQHQGAAVRERPRWACRAGLRAGGGRPRRPRPACDAVSVQRDGRRAEQRAQVAGRAGGAVGGQPLAQGGCGQRGGVQGVGTSPGRPATRGRGDDAGRRPVRGGGRRRPAS